MFVYFVDLISSQSAAGPEVVSCANVLEEVTTKLTDLELNIFEKFKTKQDIKIDDWNKFMQQYFDIEGLLGEMRRNKDLDFCLFFVETVEATRAVLEMERLQDEKKSTQNKDKEKK